MTGTFFLHLSNAQISVSAYKAHGSGIDNHIPAYSPASQSSVPSLAALIGSLPDPRSRIPGDAKNTGNFPITQIFLKLLYDLPHSCFLEHKENLPKMYLKDMLLHEIQFKRG